MIVSIFPAIFIGLGIIQPFLEKVHNAFFGRYSEPDVEPFVEAMLRYRDADKEWLERQTEAGRAYWREKRGIAFEQAVKELLVRRGALVELTKITGDGGVDLVVSLGDSIFWCQCKGLASPVGVAAVRQIAGVCSRNQFVPVLIAVNGYTSAAISTAKELDVLLIDTKNLVRMAQEQHLSRWH